MHQFRYIILIFLMTVNCLAQDKKIDSLKNAIHLRKAADSIKAELYFSLAIQYLFKDDGLKANRYIDQADKIAKRLNNYYLMAKVFDYKSNVTTNEANYFEALHYKFQELKIIEKSKDSTKIPELLSAIASLYDDIGDFDSAIKYAHKSVELRRFSSIQAQALHNNILGYLYLQQKNYNLALSYFQKGLYLARSLKDDPDAQYAFALYGLGRINLKSGHAAIAEANYRESLKINAMNETGWTEILLMLNYSGLAEVFESRRQYDSAIIYYEKSLTFSKSQNQKRTETLRELAGLYQQRDVMKANSTLWMLLELNDSIYNRQKINNIQNLTFNEKLRQQDIVEKQRLEAEERRHHLQYAGIAVIITLFLGLLMVLSNSVTIGEKWLKILGIVGLLLSFEFLNLLLHPYIAHLTHHSPVGMLLIMVVVAALLVPLHHKIEHWAIHKMVERNKQTRLAIAKKILEKHQLETAETNDSQDG